MPRKPINFELDFMIKYIFPRFTVKQFDDVSFNIKPLNQGLDYDTTGMTGKIFVGVNNDMFMQTTNIAVSSNNINVLLDKNMLQKSGRAYAEIELTDKAGTITSSSFIFDIDPKIGEGGQIPGEYEGFVEKYERLISEFKSQVSSTINNCNNKVNTTINNCNTNVNNKLNSVDSLVNVKISDFEKRFNRLTSSQQQSSEVIDARDGETSLKARLDRDIANTNRELEKIKKLEESTVSTVTTESGFTTVEETSNGYFEDVKLEGKTLVNLSTLGNKILSNSTDTGRRIDFNKEMIKSDTDYTIIMNVGNVSNGTRPLIIQWDFIDGSASKFNEINSNVSNLANSVVVFKFRQNGLASELKRVYLSLHINNPSDCTCDIQNCIVLEGDHTQNPPSYFEGLMSVGEDVDEIVVESVNENLLDINNYIKGTIDGKFVPTGDIVVEGNNITINTTANAMISYRIPKTHCKLHLGSELSNVTCYIYDGATQIKTIMTSVKVNGKFIIDIDASNLKDPLISIYRGTGAPNTLIYKDVAVTVNEQITNLKHQADKKPLLYYNPTTETWEKPILRQWDSIEKHSDGKYYYHKRSGEVVLNGSESWMIYNNVVNNTFSVKINHLDNMVANSFIAICDKFKYLTPYDDIWNGDTEGISITQTALAIRVDKSKLSTQDVQGFKQWLQANNATVVYQLANEEVYECANIDLITYADETNYIVNCGAISPKSTLKVHNNISNVVKILQEKVSLLESNVKASQEVQDMMILESDMRILDMELALMEHMPITLNLGENSMLRSATYFNFIKNHIVNETYSKEYLENVMNKYLATNRLTQEEYDELYKLLYPPVYDIELPIEY